MIPLILCKHGYLYKLKSRNLNLGVYNELSKGFVGIRLKLGAEYLFTEYHWETGPPFGTVCPEQELELCPIEDLSETHKGPVNTGSMNQLLFAWLKSKESNP